jgi:hypothetical protein
MNQLTLKNLRDHRFNQEDLSAIVFGVLGIGLWALLVYELATHLLPPSL